MQALRKVDQSIQLSKTTRRVMLEKKGQHIKTPIEETMFRLQQIHMFPNSTGDTNSFRATANML